MAKVKITLEADVTDLKSFFPNEPKGITIENVAGVLHYALVCDANVRVLDTMMCQDHAKKNPTIEAILRHRRDEVELGQRLMGSIKIQLIEETKLNPEEYLILPSGWPRLFSEMPKPCQKIVEESAKLKQCVGIGYNEAAGWFILASGQGPCLCWAEHPDKFEKVFGKV